MLLAAELEFCEFDASALFHCGEFTLIILRQDTSTVSSHYDCEQF